MAACVPLQGIAFAIGSTGGSIMVSFALGAAAELPAYVATAFAIERMG